MLYTVGSRGDLVRYTPRLVSGRRYMAIPTAGHQWLLEQTSRATYLEEYPFRFHRLDYHLGY